MTLPAYVTAHADDQALNIQLLLEILTPTPRRYTTYNVPLVSGGNTYSTRAFTVSALPQNRGLVLNLTVSIDDGDLSLVTEDLSTATGVARSRLNIYAAWVDPADNVTVQAAVTRFRGMVSKFTHDDIANAAVLECIGPVNLASKMFPRYFLSPACPFDFKDTNCGYAGGLTTCLRTFADCTAHANTARFGGCRNIPGPGTKITWGNGGYRLGG